MYCRFCGHDRGEAAVCPSCGRTDGDEAVQAGAAAPPTTGPAPVYGMAPKTNGKAVTSLVLGILSLVSCGPFTGIPAIILGTRARAEIRQAAGAEDGEGLATAGSITGWIGTILLGLAWLALLAIFVIALLGSSASARFSSVGSAVN